MTPSTRAPVSSNRRPVTAVCMAWIACLCLAPLPVTGQTPPLPIHVPIPGQEIPAQADTLPEADTLEGEVRQRLPRNVPSGRVPVPTGVERGIWEWDRTALLNHPSLTLHDLLSFVPGATMVRGGDIGTPVAVTWAGMGGGHIRVFLDGVEDAPLEGSVVDLAQVGLTGIERVRIERGSGEIRIHLTSHRFDDGRPLTVLEVGTGDLRTNLFRAGFAHPDALGGTILVALDRFDTDGPLRQEPGALFGTRLRYSIFPVEGMGVAVEYRSRTARRPEGTWQPREVDRSEFSARAGWELREGVTAEFHALRASVSLGERSVPEADSLLPEDPRSSVGGRLTVDAGPFLLWTGGALNRGLGWPSSRLETGATVGLASVGGVSARWDRESWSEFARTGRDSELPSTADDAGGWSIRGWTAPLVGVSLFAEAERARRGVPFAVPGPRVPAEEGNGEPGNGEGGGDGEAPDDPDDGDEAVPVPFDPVRILERSGIRAGARVALRGAHLSAAWLRVEADALNPLGLPFDRGEPMGPGGQRMGFEVEGRVPLTLLLRGLAVSGTGQFWEEGEAWRYLPDRTWTGEVSWYREGYDGDLEVWADVGVRGRDPMAVDPGPGETLDRTLAPFTQSWFARLQFRVATVRVFVQWENIAFKDDNADLPGRFQPQSRATYGVRWTMWN